MGYSARSLDRRVRSSEEGNQDSAEPASQGPLNFERVVTEISDRLLACDPNDLGPEIERDLRLLAEFFEVDRCTFWERSEDDSTFTVLHSFNLGQAIPPSLRADSFSWFMEELSAGRPIVLESLSDLPAHATNERSYWLEHNLQSTLLVPITAGTCLKGCLSLAAMRGVRSWPAEYVRRLQLAGQVLAN